MKAYPDGSTTEDYHDTCVWRHLLGKYLRVINQETGILHEVAMNKEAGFNFADRAQIHNLWAEYETFDIK